MLPRWQSWRPSGVTPSTSPRSKKKRRSGKRSRKWRRRRLPGKATLRAALAPAVAFRLAATFRPAAAGAAEKKPGNSAVRPVPKKEDWWLKRHESFVERAKKGHVDLLFLGDSITHDWEGRGKDVWKERFEPLRAANFGIGGDRTEHLRWRLTEGKALAGIQPKGAALMNVTNTMRSNTAAD